MTIVSHIQKLTRLPSHTARCGTRVTSRPSILEALVSRLDDDTHSSVVATRSTKGSTVSTGDRVHDRRSDRMPNRSNANGFHAQSERGKQRKLDLAPPGTVLGRSGTVVLTFARAQGS